MANDGTGRDYLPGWHMPWQSNAEGVNCLSAVNLSGKRTFTGRISGERLAAYS